jgi:hypothetical protein
MTTDTKAEHSTQMISWKYFVICVFAGLAPYGLLMASLPLFDHFNCKLSWQAVCDGPSWVVALANAVTGISWLVILTFPMSVVFFVGGLAINWNRWFFGRSQQSGPKNEI